MTTDPYAALGVSRAATLDEIVRAYRRQLRAYHPDTRSAASSSGAGEQDEQLAQILAAYELLRDPCRRAAYDRTIKVVRKDAAATRVAVTPAGPGHGKPPLWAGPVRWRPSR